MGIKPETLWAVVGPVGVAPAAVMPFTIREERSFSISKFVDAYALPDESGDKAWKRARRFGWRCVRVVVSIEERSK